MDSPESSKPATTTCETAPAQDSPFSSFIINLSPIPPVKAPSVTQGFPELNSPPLVFTSPQPNHHRQPTFLKRAQFPRTLIEKLTRQLEDGKNRGPTIEGHEKLDIQLTTRLVDCGEKGSDSSSTVNSLIQSPSGCNEQFLADIVNEESVDPNFSFDSTSKKSEYNDQPPDDVKCSKEILVKFEPVLNSRKIEEPPLISGQAEEVHKENTLINVSALGKDIKQGDGVSADHWPKIGPELPVDHALANKDEDDSMTAVSDDQCNVENENFVEATKATLTEPVPNKVQNDLKAFQHRGARRRCLQFEDAQHKVISNWPAKNPSDGEGVKSTPLMPINVKCDDMIQSMLYPINDLNASIKIPTPSRIGLHLNSIVNTVQAGSSAIVDVKGADWGEFSILEKNSMPMVNSHLSDYSDGSSTLSLPASVSATTDDDKHESHASVAADSAMALPAHIFEPSNSAILSSKVNQSTPVNKRKGTEKDGGSDECNNLSPKKKRMKSLDPSDGYGCKRCNCKRSKCLKLYCDCFAAGIYCAEPCACQECFNRPEFEDTVLETRQKIESRDPFAFAPKVVEHMIDQAASSCGEDGTRFTPASARHKKGCKCKKSMCLKKYCECYQANVGCSDGCRCEGCKNVFGQKGEYGMTKVLLTGEDTHETTDGSLVEQCEITASGNDTSYPIELVNLHNLTPLTPAFEFSNHGKEASKAWFPSAKYYQSPESGFTYVMSPGSPRNSDNKVMISETADEILDLVSFDHESHHSNTDTVEYSAARHQSGNMAPASDVPKLADHSKAQSFPAKRTHSSGSSLAWRGTPIAPMAQFSGDKVDLSNIMQDDTPEILKDSSIPLGTVKASSPNKKRVSPPHGRQLHEFGSSSLAGIQAGRRFILKAVPSFPPLTPCIDSKCPVVQQANNPENRSGDK